MTLGHVIALFAGAIAGGWLALPFVLWAAAAHQRRKRAVRHPGPLPEEVFQRVVERQREAAPWQ